MLWFIFCKEEVVLTETGHIPCSDKCPVDLLPWNTIHQLPDLDGEPCSTVRIDSPVTPGTVSEGMTLHQVGLRASYFELSPEEYKMAGKAQEILYWDANTQFCGVCGGPMEKDSDISKKCTCCGKQIWPSVAPAIIVLIRRQAPSGRKEDEEILMVRARNFRGDYYGLVAGFLETGESLEDCLHREVMEETGIRIKNAVYKASQPWPYPSGLMVGYFAEYESGEIHLQKSELSSGGWFRRDNLPEIPGKMSLARQLIDMWLAEE